MIRLAFNGLISFSDMPLRVIVYLGFLITSLSVIGSLVIVMAWITGAGFFVRGWTSLFLVQIFTTGINLMVVGAVGLYVGRIHNQVKNRPLYLIESEYPPPPVRATETTPSKELVDNR
jgi:dolichol-phosphate mannosyltransferase